MAFLDFINNRQGQRPAGEQQSQQQKPDTYKQAKTREAVEDKAALKPLDKLPEQPRADLNEVKARMEKASQQLNQNAPAPAPSQADSTNDSREAQRQMMTSQDKAAPDLSPTSAQRGATAKEQDASKPSQEPPSKTQEQPKERSRQTIARPRPSYER
jgi:hypothetical protein